LTGSLLIPIQWDREWDFLEEGTMARTHVVMSEETLRAIDEIVGARGRSRFLEEAAREKLARLALEDALGETSGIAKGRRYEHWKDREAARAWVRSTRSTERAS
jgi:metal-responsive CopG/Arc/MetJ family transcriptional regulator